MGNSVGRDSYDFIVVGAGAAGCAIAGRLSENTNVSVLLLEAGIHDLKHPDIHIPSRLGKLQGSEVDWEYYTEPKEGIMFGLRNQCSYWPRGKTLGGSTSINYMTHIRGVPADYDEWASEHGCTGWEWDNVLPYFKKLEGNRIPSLSSKYHSSAGPLRVSSYQNTDHPVVQAFIEGCVELGHQKNEDPNGETQLGVTTKNPVICFNGQRWSTAEAYLRPAELDGRDNLDIVTCAHVTRILINDAKEAQGVYYKLTNEHNSAEKLVRCEKEVIISGGAVNSPQILMLSGIGPKKHLEELGIDCVADLPTGENLIDHLSLCVDCGTHLRTVNGDTCATKDAIVSYLERREGPIADPSGNAAMLFAHSGVRPDLEEKGMPDQQFYLLAGGPGSGKKWNQPHNMWNYAPEYDIQDHECDQYPDNQLQILFIFNHPKSIGRLTLRSTDPFEKPKIDPNYLDEEDDLKVLVASMKRIYELYNTEAMKKVRGDFKPISKCPYEIGSDEWAEWSSKAFVNTGWHPVGTCRMGRLSAKETVVSPTLEVKGVKNLRVADASIMPVIISGNTMTPSIMIGEKASDMIKDKWGIVDAMSKL